MGDIDRLRRAVWTVYDDPAYRPKDDKTFCNQAVQAISKFMGYDKFSGLLANDMIALMRRSPDWGVVPMEAAQITVNQGELLIAGLQDMPHGHVCVLVPGDHPPIFSGKWARTNIPWCMNVGKTCFMNKGLNYAFAEVPEIFQLNEQKGAV